MSPYWKRPDKVQEFVDRNEDIVDMRLQGYTLQEIGEKFGVSRERVRQVLASRQATSIGHQVRREQREQAVQEGLYAKFAELAKEATPCAVCGYWVLRPFRYRNPDSIIGPNGKPLAQKPKRTCSPECAEAWRVLRYHLDPDYRDRHRKAVARVLLRTHTHKGRSTNYTLSQQRYAVKILNNKPYQRQEQTYVIPGSEQHQKMLELGLPFRTAEDAFAGGLPWDSGIHNQRLSRADRLALRQEYDPDYYGPRRSNAKDLAYKYKINRLYVYHLTAKGNWGPNATDGPVNPPRDKKEQRDGTDGVSPLRRKGSRGTPASDL